MKYRMMREKERYRYRGASECEVVSRGKYHRGEVSGGRKYHGGSGYITGNALLNPLP